MKTRLTAALGFVGAFFVIAPMLLAQWPAYPTRGTPRNAAGQPDLAAPAPRTAAGQPDFSGLWDNGRNTNAPQRGARGVDLNTAPGRGRGASGAGPPSATFFNVGAGFPEGLPFQPWAAELVRKRMADNSKDNPDAHCLPMGFMQFHTHSQPRKIIQTADVIIIIYEANSGLRQIFLDGRPLPGKDVEPWWYGYSVGKWEGDTLVVETTNFIDNIWLDVRGSPLTSAGKVTERIRRPNYGTLEIEVTIDDPKAYTRPWTVRVNHRIFPDTELIEFICEERDATHYVGAQPTATPSPEPR
jgi:hypothetical protein